MPAPFIKRVHPERLQKDPRTPGGANSPEYQNEARNTTPMNRKELNLSRNGQQRGRKRQRKTPETFAIAKVPGFRQ